MEELNQNIPDKCLMNGNNNFLHLNNELYSMDEKDINGNNPNKKAKSDFIENNLSSDKNNDDSRRKRRSKNDLNGRMYQCECGKSYLSHPALTNHKKMKHENTNSLAKRGRGRPRKNPSLLSNNKDNNEIKIENFFEDEKRKKRENERYRIIDITKIIFKEVFEAYKPNIENKYERMEDNIFLRLIHKIYNNEDKKFHDELLLRNKSCDNIFVEYLEFISGMCNKEYFVFAFKFLVLFRECINKYKNVELVNRKCILNEEIPDDVTEYTQKFNADQVPDLCNEFISDFMENANYFGLNSNEERNEFVQIIQHLCYWLFKRSFTSSKLTLIS